MKRMKAIIDTWYIIESYDVKGRIKHGYTRKN